MKATVSGLGDVGMITDVDASELPPNGWNSLLNIRCTHGRIEPIDGYADVTTWTNVGTKDVYAHALVSLATTASYFWVYPYDDDGDGQCEAIRQYNGATDTTITRTTGAYVGTSSDLWNTCQFNGLVILNNGNDNPQYWDGVAANCADLKWDATHTWDDTAGGGETYKAKVIRSFKNFLFALNINDNGTAYPQMVHWSSIADPGNIPIWDFNLATEESARIVLSQTDGHVLDAVSLGETMLLYKEDGIWQCPYVGGQFVFDSDPIVTSHGLYTTGAVVDIGGQHVVMGDGVVYLFDGSRPKNILDGKVAKSFFDQIDTAAYKKCFLTHNKSQTEVWLCFPESGETWATKALIWNYGNNTWYYRTIPASSTIAVGIVESTETDAIDDGTETTLAFDSETVLAIEYRTYSPIGDTLVSASDQLEQFGQGVTSDLMEAVRTNLVVEDSESWYMTRKMIPVGTGDAFQIAIGGQVFVDGPVFWESPQSFDPGVTRKLDWRTSYPVKSLRITDTMGGAWTFNKYTVDHVKVGER